jgi:hypothetical protein
MKRQVRLEIITEDDTDVDPPKRITIDAHPSTAQCHRDCAGPIRVAPSRQHLGQPGKRVSIPEEYYVKALASKQAGGGTCRALSPGTVQDFNLDPLRRTHGSSRNWRWRCWRRGQKHRRRNEADRPRP